MKVGNDTVCDDRKKAEACNSFFLKSSDINDCNTCIPKLDVHLQAGQTVSDILITKEYVFDLLKCLDVNKASGPDIVNHAMLKMAGDVIMPSSTWLFNLSLSGSVFLSIWIKANVVPIFNKNDCSS